MIIDVHAHAYLRTELDAINKRAELLDGSLSAADPNKWSIKHDPTIEGLLEAEREAGVDRFVLLPITSNLEKVALLNRWVYELSLTYKEIIPFATWLPTGFRRDLRTFGILERGIRGVKIHPFLQRIDILSKEAMALFEELEAEGLIVVLDTMDLKGLLRYKPHLRPVIEPFQNFSVDPTKIAHIAKKFEGLTIIAAHMGCLYGWEKIEPLLELPNVYFDTSFVSGILEPEKAVYIMEKKGFDHILFGTDAPWRRPSEVLRWLESLRLTQEHIDLIRGKNLLRLLAH